MPTPAPILAGDIKLLASKVMDDVPNGGGGPTGTVIPDGASNAIFGDVTERQRAGGGVSIRQLHLAVQTGNTAAYMDPSIIVSQLPNDANVSITLAKCGMFAKRTEIANAIENYLIQGPEWSGYLLENHVAGMRNIQLFQRPGTPTPPIGRTLVLVFDEGKPGEVRQFVRVTRVEVERRTFTYSTSGGFVDYPADVVVCDLLDALRSNFAGSPPDRGYTRSSTKTVVRDTTVADAATFYGASPLTAVAALGGSTLRVASIFTQLVPSARTEVIALDQRPASQRVLTLATAPREVTVGAAPHTTRIKVGQENRGFSWVNILKPFPAPNTVVVSYMAQGVWYTLTDDGAGQLTGAGVGTVNYANGSIAVTTQALPDVGSAIIYSWGEKSAFVNRQGQAGFRAPEYALKLDHAGIKKSTLVIKWTSGAVLRTATDNGTGLLTGDATGEFNYASGDLFLRPKYMPDAGAQFAIDYEWATLTTKSVTVSPDAGGFDNIVLDTVPAAGSVTVQWTTVRDVTSSSGASASGTAASKKAGSTTTYIWGKDPNYKPPVSLTRIPVAGDAVSQKYMAPGGIRVATGDTVYIEVAAEFAPTGYYYPVPDVTGVTWSEVEFKQLQQKSIGGIAYYVWGYVLPKKGYVSAGS